jgi:bifunctional DNA-binding transcriptional regulator/antitoxin component of YhaV-PrlF toxin-antitoxin module
VPLTEKVKFEARLQRGNRVQVPKMVRWRFKLESYQILEVTVSLLATWSISPRSFLTRMSKDGRIVIPKQTLNVKVKAASGLH